MRKLSKKIIAAEVALFQKTCAEKKLFHLTNPFFQELRSKECVGRVNGDTKENKGRREQLDSIDIKGTNALGITSFFPLSIYELSFPPFYNLFSLLNSLSGPAPPPAPSNPQTAPLCI